MKPEDVPFSSHDLTGEAWREYRWTAPDGVKHVHRIESPQTLFLKTKNGRPGTTHRVLDADNVVHIVPAIGLLGCVVCYEPNDMDSPVQF